MGHEDAVYLAKLAEQAERYEGMYSWASAATSPPSSIPQRVESRLTVDLPAIQRWSRT